MDRVDGFGAFAEAFTALLDAYTTAQLAAAPLEPHAVLTAAQPLFATLHEINRTSSQQATQLKAVVAHHRRDADEAHLGLMNTQFEVNHLRTEIAGCEAFDSEYSTLPLHPLDELAQLSSDHLPSPLPSDSHQLMLTRLNFELQERQRYDEDKKLLGLEKSRLIKENQGKKERLEALEASVDAFMVTAREIQTKMKVEF